MAEPPKSERAALQLLLLGDNAFKRKLAKLSLRALGARVAEVDDVEAAEARLTAPVADATPRVDAVIVMLEESDGIAATGRLSAISGAAYAVALERDDRASRIAAASAGAALTLREPIDWASALDALRPSLRAASATRRSSDESSPDAESSAESSQKTPPRPASIAPTRWRWYPDEDRVDAGEDARAAMLAPQGKTLDGLDAFIGAAREPEPRILRAALDAALTVTGETFLVGQVADARGVAAGFGLFAERRRDGEGRVFLTGAAHRVAVESGKRVAAPRDRETGLPLRDELQGSLALLVEQLRAERRRCAVISVDLPDLLDLVAEARQNLTAEDGAADDLRAALFSEVGRRLRDTLREGDLLARDEGARFLIVQPSVLNLDDVRGLARRLLAALAEPFSLGAAGGEACLSASVGAAVGPDRRRGAAELILAAHAAARRAGREGPRRFVIDAGATHGEGDAMGRAQRRRAALTALERGAFEVYYQPSVGPEGAVASLDALIRLRDGEGWVDPEAVVDAIESRGDVAGFLERFLAQAVEDLALWRQAFGVAPRLGVKLTGPALVEGRAVDAAALALAEHGFSVDRLRIEVSDRRLGRNRADAARELRRAQSAGAEITFEGFGGAETTIETLGWAPVDRVKLARSLCRAPQTRRLALIEGAARLASAFGAQAGLIGAEDSETVALAFEAGCDEAQGFAIAPPAPISELVVWFSGDAAVQGGLR